MPPRPSPGGEFWSRGAGWGKSPDGLPFCGNFPQRQSAAADQADAQADAQEPLGPLGKPSSPLGWRLLTSTGETRREAGFTESHWLPLWMLRPHLTAKPWSRSLAQGVTPGKESVNRGTRGTTPSQRLTPAPRTTPKAHEGRAKAAKTPVLGRLWDPRPWQALPVKKGSAEQRGAGLGPPSSYPKSTPNPTW